jgi:hypothetical protein
VLGWIKFGLGYSYEGDVKLQGIWRRDRRICRAKLWVGGGLGMIQIKGLVFGDDFFELRFDARSILLVGEFNKFLDLLIKPIEIATVSL